MFWVTSCQRLHFVWQSTCTSAAGFRYHQMENQCLWIQFITDHMLQHAAASTIDDPAPHAPYTHTVPVHASSASRRQDSILLGLCWGCATEAWVWGASSCGGQGRPAPALNALHPAAHGNPAAAAPPPPPPSPPAKPMASATPTEILCVTLRVQMNQSGHISVGYYDLLDIMMI